MFCMYTLLMLRYIQHALNHLVHRAMARALIGGGGVYIHIFVISFEINPNDNLFQKKLVGHNMNI